MAEDKKEFQRRFEAFHGAGKAENWNKAIELGEALRAEFPDSFTADERNTKNLATAYNNRGTTFVEMEQYERAIADFDKAIELEPEDAGAYVNRGTSYHDLKQYERAIAYYDKAIEIKPDKEVLASAYNNRGTSYHDLKRYERAIEDFDIAIELEPEGAGAYVNRGSSYNELKQYERAIKDFDKAIKINSEYATAYNNRGSSYNELKQYERAIKDFDKAIELKANLGGAYNNRGNSYLGLEEYERAIEDYDKAIKIDPKDVGAYHNRAIAIGQKTMQATLESYEKQLSSITDPAEINKRFEARKKISEERLNRYREYTGWCIGTLALLVPIIWFDLFNKTEILTGNCETNDCSNFFLITKNISFALTTLFLLSPVFLALRYCNRNARIERHTLEDYDRKSIMLLIRNLEGAHIQTLMEHLDKRGTPEVLNKLYHPKQAHAQDSQQDSREGLLTSLPRINPAD